MASRTTEYSSSRRSMRSFLRLAACSGDTGSRMGLPLRPGVIGTVASAFSSPDGSAIRFLAGAGLRVNQLNNDMVFFLRRASAHLRKECNLPPCSVDVRHCPTQRVGPRCQVDATRRRRLPSRLDNTAPAAMARLSAMAGWRLLNSVKRSAVSAHSLLGAAACTVALRG